MSAINGYRNLKETPRASIVTIGNFDGVHTGHRQILDQMILKAKQSNLASVIYTFRPHPQIALRPQSNIQLLSTYEEKIEMIEALNPNFVIEEPFTREFSSKSPEDFFNLVLLKQLHCNSLIVGYDFGFGKDRAGSMKLLEEFCQKNSVILEVVQPFSLSGQTVSSTAIRNLLSESRLSEANQLLGYSFYYQSHVIKGNQRGRTIGFPTANLKINKEKLILPFGVYKTHTEINGASYESITNIGVRPTIENDQDQPLCETHIFDFDSDIYGQKMKVSFLEKIRNEKKFDSIEELKKQIIDDVSKVRG